MANYKKYKEEFESFIRNLTIDIENELNVFSTAVVPDDWQLVVSGRRSLEVMINNYAAELQGVVFFLHCYSYVNEDYLFEKQDFIRIWKSKYLDLMFKISDEKFNVWKERQVAKLTESAT